jgi:hypothetical protein
MTGTWRGPTAYGAALVALGVVAGTVRPAAGPEHIPTAQSIAVSNNAIVCPDTSGESDGAGVVTVANVSGQLPGETGAAADLQSTPLTGTKPKTESLGKGAVTRLSSTADGTAVLLQATGKAAGAVVADQNRLIPRGIFRALLSAPCLTPGTDWWIGGADGRVGYSDRLIIANPGSTLANVTVTAWSDKGHQEPPALQSYSVQPNATAVLPVSQFVPNAKWVTLHVHANSGRIASEVLDRRLSGIEPIGSDWIPPTLPPGRDFVVPGYLRGESEHRLLISNPGAQDATVSLRLSTTTANFVPAGHQNVVVAAGHSTEVELAQSLGGLPGAAVVHSDQVVVVAGYSVADRHRYRDRPDLQWQPAASPITRAAVLPNNAPPFDETARIYFTATGDQARIRVTPQTGSAKVVTVPAGRTLAWDPIGELGGKASYGPVVLTPVGGGPVYVSRTLFAYGAHGPLVTSEQPTLLPESLTLPAVVPDPRAGIP